MPLDANIIAGLLAADKEKSKRSGTRTPKDATEPREYKTWFKLMHAHATCSNPECVDERKGGGVKGSAMCATVNDARICRYCFLSGYGRSV